MKCTNCGTEIEEGSLFCTGCGKKVSDMVQKDIPTVMVDDEVLDEIEIPRAQDAASDTAKQETPKQTAAGADETDDTTKKKYRLIGMIAVAVIAVAVVLLIMFMKRGSGAGDSNEKKLVYDQDGVLYYVPNMDKDADPIEIDETRDDTSWGYNFSPSGKYLYYQAYNSRNMLCRVELAKLKAGSNKNLDYIEEIDTDVEGYMLIDDERLVYRDNDSTLYYYDGKEETEIDDSVADYNLEADTIYYTIYDEDDYDASYYYYDTTKKDGDCMIKNADVRSIDYKTGTCYVMDGDEVYEVSKNGDEERVLSGIDNVVSASVESKRIYFVRERSTEKTLYDFVDDPYVDDDAAQNSEPDIYDYLQKVSEKTALTRQGNAFLAEFPEDRYMYINDNSNWEDELNMSAYYNSDDDETYYFDAVAEIWYTCDWDSYYDDRTAYEDAQTRDELRDELKNETYTWNYTDLYVWNQGSDEQELVESIDADSLSIDCDHQILYYRKAQTDDSKQNDQISIDNIYDTDSVREWLNGYSDDEDDYDNEDDEDYSEPDATYYVMVGTKEQEMDAYMSGMHVSDDGKNVILWIYEDDEDTLYDYNVTSDGLKEAGKVTDHVYRGSWVGDSYYYMTSDDDEYGDLAVYKNQKSTTLAKNISLYSVNVYADGNTCAYKDYDDMDLRLYDSNGNDTKIGKDIDSYSYINANRIVYQKNDNLYVYTGKDEDRRIVRDMAESDGYRCFEMNAEF